MAPLILKSKVKIIMLETAINRYGGLKLWQKIDSIEIDIVSLGGMIPVMKGLGRTFPHIGRVQIFPKKFRTVFFDPSGTEIGTFEAGKVWLKNEAPVENYRTKFNGFAKLRRWNTMDAIYFFGYALTTYLNIPFILSDLQTHEEAWQGGFSIEALFPKEIHTHNPRQKFYFNQEGLLVRHDYHAEILGPGAWGAHFTSSYQEVHGLPVARKRKVYLRLGNWVSPIPVLHATLEPVNIHFLP